MKDLILKFAYFLEASQGYYSAKHFIYQFLEDTTSKKKRYFDFVMIFLVLSTVGILIFEVNHKPIAWLNTYETVAIFIFICEWLGRLWVISHSHKQIIKDYEKSQLINQPFNLGLSFKKIMTEKLSFIFSPMSIIDLLAILPSYRPLRILRILMLFRLFKLLRYANSIKQFSDVFVEKRFEFFTLAIMFFMAISFGSTIIFIYEGAGVNPNITSFFDAVYWSIITISTVGFGDITPVTVEGRVATLFLVVGGLSVIAFFTSIVTTALSARLVALKEEKVIGEANALKDFILICGYGQMGKVLADEFRKIKQKFIVIDHDNEMLVHASSQQILSIKGDATDPTFLTSIGINKGASTIVALTNNDAVNLSIILTARSQNPNINIIARANNSNIKDKLLIAGANEVIAANDIAALVATEYIGQPIAFEAIDDILLNSENAIMDEVELFANSPFIGYKLETINFSNFNLTLIGIMETANTNQFKFNPKKDQYILKEKDILIVIGYKEAIVNFKIDLLSKKSKNKLAIKKKGEK
ncbi:MAG: NAD-binding protein [Arcobacteraceae bacterium]|nr:NAD-binding protein [Arcobacteraceae bacterium]